MKLFTKGLDDWLLARVTSLFLALYTTMLLANAVFGASGAVAWRTFLQLPTVKLLGALAVPSVVLHTTLGFWTVATDYIKPIKIQYYALVAAYLWICIISICALVLLLII